MAEKEHLNSPISEADAASPPKVKLTSQTGLDLSFLYSTQQGCPPGTGRQAAEGCGIDSKVKAKWGVGEVSLHQGMTTGPFRT